MLGKQFFLDVIIIISLPILIIGGYFLWWRDTSEALLSVSTEMLKTDSDAPGARTKLALETLNTITFDESLFKDRAFLSLKKYTVEIPTAELARDYPFTPPAVISEMLKRASPKSSNPKAESISVKLDLLKSSAVR